MQAQKTDNIVQERVTNYNWQNKPWEVRLVLPICRYAITVSGEF